MTTQSKSQLQEIWLALLNGSLSPEAARRLLAEVITANGNPLSPESIDSLLQSAATQRQQGIAAGAEWAKTPQQPQQQGPINVGPVKYNAATGLPEKNYGALPEEANPYGAFQRGLEAAGRDVGIGSGEFGDYLRSRFAPTSATFLGQRALRGLLPAGQMEPENAFQQYAQQTGGGNLGSQAQTTFTGLMNRLRGGGTIAAGDPLLGFLEDYRSGAALAREAARGRLGGYASSALLPSDERLISQFRAGPTGAQTTDFLAYLQRALGL